MLGLICGALILGQSSGQSTAAPDPIFTPEQMRADLQIAHDIFAADDAGFYRYVPKDELDAIWKNAEDKITRPMDAFDFYRILLPTVAAHECGHSGASLPTSMLNEITSHEPLLPFYVKSLAGGAYVYRDLSDGSQNDDGAEIKSINGVPMRRILKTMLSDICMDGNGMSGKRARASGEQFDVYLVSLFGLRAPYNVSLVRPGSHSETMQLDGIEMPTFQEKSVRKGAEPADLVPADFKLLDDGQIGLLTVRGFFSADKDHPTETIFDDAFQTLAAMKSKALIIDVRDNGGGEDELGRDLLSYFENKPYKYYDHLLLNGTYLKSSAYTGDYSRPPDGLITHMPDGSYEATGHPNWGTMQPAAPHFSGKVFILINGGSFSTTCEFLSHIKSERLATLIGQDTAGNYYGNTSGFVKSVTLPNTNMRIRVPSLAYWITVDHRFPATSPITPDVRVEPTIDDLVAKRDVQMDRALAMARKVK